MLQEKEDQKWCSFFSISHKDPGFPLHVQAILREDLKRKGILVLQVLEIAEKILDFVVTLEKNPAGKEMKANFSGSEIRFSRTVHSLPVTFFEHEETILPGADCTFSF